MCGIIITLDSPGKHEMIAHRGTEYNAVEVKYGPDKDHAWHLGHYRLPIQTEEGDKFGQPIYLGHGRFLLYNGEIFNYPNKYGSDVEYLIDLFKSESISDVLEEANKWDGFWSIVYVSEYGTKYCFTDPLGKKQLYYNTSGEICSEILPLVKDQTRFDEHFKSSVYKWGYNMDDSTPWPDVKRIIPNKLYVFSSTGEILNINPGNYFSWEPTLVNSTDLKDPEATSFFIRSILETATINRLISRKHKISALLSGGLDSSIIASILAKFGADVELYTTDNIDDIKYATLMALELDKSLHVVELPWEEERIARYFKANETPIDLGSVVPCHDMFSSLNETIVLTGDGADELFGGYRRSNEYDSQKSDIFEELTYYHLPRLDRASMAYTKELRNPFLCHELVRLALKIPYEQRIGKSCLKKAFSNSIPGEILNRPKEPLKTADLRMDPKEYKKSVFNLFYNKLFL